MGVFEFIALVILGLIVFFFFIFNRALRVSCWKELALNYPYQGQRIDRKIKVLQFSINEYRVYFPFLIVGSNSEGIYLGTASFLDKYMPPVFVQWNQLLVKEKSWAGSYLNLGFSRVPGAQMNTASPKLDRFLKDVIPSACFVKEDRAVSYGWLPVVVMVVTALIIFVLFTQMQKKFENSERKENSSSIVK